ncbi:MAG TPA: hypothetical protein VMW27_23395 [Thermoanaerobaculia bacterium]|nr:hypothetical protein [Thermoanaerobaculia bacterium]
MSIQSKYGCLVCVMLLLGMTPSRATGLEEPKETTPPGAFKCDHLQEATVKYGNSDLLITLPDAELIKQAVEEYLAKEKTKLDPSVTGPGEVFITCDGKVRMGAWLLESSSSDEPELHLTFLIPTGANFRIYEVVSLRQVERQWQVEGVGRRTAHLKY